MRRPLESLLRFTVFPALCSLACSGNARDEAARAGPPPRSMRVVLARGCRSDQNVSETIE